MTEFGNGHKIPGESRDVRVLITGAGTATALSVLKGLRFQKEVPVQVMMADAQDNVAGKFFADGFFQIPPATDPGFLPAIKDICNDCAIDLLIPIVDPEFLPLSEAAPEFLDCGTRVVISDPEVISTCGDKLTFAQFIQSLNLPVAEIFDTERVVAAGGPFPLFVKPRRGGRASIGTTRVDNPRELAVALDRLQDPLVQEYIEGVEYTVDTLSDFNGRFIAAMPRVRMETKSGVSVKGTTVYDRELLDVVKTIVEAMGIKGPSNIQCFRRPDGSLVISELNPRFSGALALSLASGLNSPLLLLKLVMGEEIDPEKLLLRHNIAMVRYWQEAFMYEDGTVDIAPWSQWRPFLPAEEAVEARL